MDLLVPNDFAPLTGLAARTSDRPWSISTSGDGRSFVLLGWPRASNWQELVTALRDELPDATWTRAPIAHEYDSHRKPRLSVFYSYGVATVFQQPRAIAAGGYGMWERLFTVIVAGEPGDPHFKEKAASILLSLRDRVFNLEFKPVQQ